MRRRIHPIIEPEAVDEPSPEGGRGGRLKPLLGAVAGAVVGLVAALWAGGQIDPVAPKLDGVVQGLQDASATVQEKISEVRASSRNSGMVRQVVVRLQQDKAIDASRIEVSSEDEGTVILRGSVPDDSHKDKAAALAHGTRGVDRVIDHLAVPPAPRVIASGSARGDGTPRIK